MQKIIDYVIITRDTPEEIEDAVREGIGEGWQPLGGVAVAEPHTFAAYSQTMVKYAEGAQ